jgi:DNA-binding LytR/AlgR family response regulator
MFYLGPSIFVKANRQTIRVNFEDILYVEGVKGYVKVIRTDQQFLTIGFIRPVLCIILFSDHNYLE